MEERERRRGGNESKGSFLVEVYVHMNLVCIYRVQKSVEFLGVHVSRQNTPRLVSSKHSPMRRAIYTNRSYSTALFAYLDRFLAK